MSWNLQVPRSSKIALTLIFGLGIFDIGVGVGRLVTVLQVDEKDFTWTEVPAIEWLALEPSIAIIVACLCVCRPLLERVLPYRWRSNTASTNLRDEHIKLVHGVSSFVQTTSSVGAGNQGGSTTASQGEPDMIPANAVHVRKDILMRADDKV